MSGCGLAVLIAISACGEVDPDPSAEQRPPATPAPEESGDVMSAAPAEAAHSVTDEAVAAERTRELAACLSAGDAAEGVSTAMADCFGTELRLQDDRLNAAYRKAMDSLNSTDRARLRMEERTWIRDRDAECAASATGGTIDRVGIPSCLLDETIRRRLVLEAIAD
jgi:uncharacterized protein YecT (DUF1311 family)